MVRENKKKCSKKNIIDSDITNLAKLVLLQNYHTKSQALTHTVL